jgi:spermidine/putrescine transport system ATP-binding protein
MVFQKYALFPHLNVYDNIAFGPTVKAMKSQEIKHKVYDMIDLVKLKGMGNRDVTKLSGLSRFFSPSPQIIEQGLVLHYFI